MTYDEFLAGKAVSDVPTGFDPSGFKPRRALFPFQADIVRWAIKRGRAAIFADCGLGKTAIQLVWAHEVAEHTRKPVLILAPLAVAEQTVAEGMLLGIDILHVASGDQVLANAPAIYITNYEKLHKFDASLFSAVVLDESSKIKSYDGSTRKQLTDSFRLTPYKLACTATPAPNDLIEIINHAEFLGVMSGKEIIALFFKQDGNTTHKWRLKGHAHDEFWRWMTTWAVNLRKPSDLGYDDDGFVLPELHLDEHVVTSSQKMDGYLFALPASSLQERRSARSASLSERVRFAADIINANDEPAIAWCNLNNESKALTNAIAGAVEVTGSMSDDEKEAALRGFSDGTIRRLVTKPVLSGFGLNWQHCALEVFVGLSDSYEQFYQAVRRCWRFGQKREVHAHIVISDLEGAVLANIKRKEEDSKRMAEQMVKFMSERSSEIIHGQKRDVAVYIPETKITLPDWMSV